MQFSPGAESVINALLLVKEEYTEQYRNVM